MKTARNVLLLMLLVFALLLTACANGRQDETTGKPDTTETTVPDLSKQTEATEDSKETTAPKTQLVLFPEAPEKATVRALPENYDTAALVSPYWEQQFKFSNLKNTEFYISIPQIYPFSEDAVVCQQEVYELFKTKLSDWVLYLLTEYEGKAVLLDKPEDVFFDQDQYRMCYSYNAGCYKDVLSVVIRINGTDVPWSYYYVYYLDLTTGMRLTTEEAHAKYAIDKTDIKSAVEAYYRKMHANFDEKLDSYQDDLKKTVSDENIDACRLLCTEDGELMILADIYTVGNVEKVEKLIELPE